jgi:hypothetical protein
MQDDVELHLHVSNYITPPQTMMRKWRGIMQVALHSAAVPGALLSPIIVEPALRRLPTSMRYNARGMCRIWASGETQMRAQ